MNEIISVRDFEAQIPVLPEDDLREAIQERMRQRDCSVIVLDDDPTGTQTVHGISVLTEWSTKVIQKELEAKTPLFFIMTNSRSLLPQKAKELAIEIGQNIGEASRKTGRDTIIISRSDSTLRGHYPIEVEGLLQASGELDTIRFIIPVFFEGGRITFQDVHYVREKEHMIPAAQTPYAKDPVFGYSSSDLKYYVEEKTKGTLKASEVFSLSIQELRNSSEEELVGKLSALPAATTCIINAAHPYDLQRFIIALLDSKRAAICRTAASFVSAMAALPDKELLRASDWKRKESSGKLILLGSHVPKSTAQVLNLLSHDALHSFELNLEELLFSDTADEQLKKIIKEMNALLQEDASVLVYTQRKLITAASDAENLHIAERVSDLLCQIAAGLEKAPHFIVAKGGITSSDIATKSLNIKKALVMGQVFPGVPVWRAGPESKFPDMPYVVFPGNVGEEDTLSKLIFSS
ncbi:MAG: four-carbon acid sugar kinase family protein [Bacteroidia bacterium]|nr:four-carbon acid sugar kinase family protein [Bacteroidia bacterium]